MNYAKKIIYQSNYWYNDGLKKAKVRDMSGAIISLKRSLQYNRENIAARNLLGLVYYGIGEVAEALVEWIISKNFRPRDNIANDYIREVQNSANELEIINQAVKKYNQCVEYCQQNSEDLAVIQLKQVITSHPTFLRAHQLLALLYLHDGQYAKAKQVLRAARKLDTTNETTLRYLHELTRQRTRKGRRSAAAERRKKSDAVEYSMGNETIIQPRHSALKELASHLAVANLFVGAVIGAALIWFLVAPAVNQSRSERLNDQMREYSEQINSLEAQVSAQTRTLDNYRAAGKETEADAQQAQNTAESYENLMTVSDQYNSGEYTNATMADTLLSVNRDSLGDNGKALCDELRESIYPGACDSYFSSGTEALASEDYESAVENLAKVVRMDQEYNDGQAVYNLAQAYQGSGDNENAVKYYQMIIENFSDSEYVQDARENYDALSGAGNGDSNASGDDSDDGGSADSGNAEG
ncbi:MAG TPA: tetratricopeptide repeat protein [Candidatus Mediterraneibacter norfolkensis]|nr:tetratricopeptide repeat protein [Candidatus Mediterraneibacter norfolkensis]